MQKNLQINKRAAWAEIDLSNLSHNLGVIKSFTDPSRTKIMAVVKADAYGHGAVEVSKQAVRDGVQALGVALAGEGIILRNAGISIPIYILGESPEDVFEDALKYDLILSINSFRKAKIICSKIQGSSKKIKINVNVDTGMNRVGIDFRRAPEEIIAITSLPEIELEGIFTHFSCASSRDISYTGLQWDRFTEIIERLKESSIRVKTFHCANSAAFFRSPKTHLDMARIGISMYGLNPFDSDFNNGLNKDTHGAISKLKPVLGLKAKICSLKTVLPGEPISYGGTFKTKRKSIIATVPVGYADGYSRVLSNKARVLIKGSFAPVAGNITMDQFMIDVTGIPGGDDISEGDEVVLIGRSGENQVTAEGIAKLMGTINYEVICMLKNRMPKVYIR